MKTLSFTLILSLSASLLLGQINPEVIVQSEVQSAKLFIGGAQIQRSAIVNLPSGSTTVIFKNLPNTIDVSTFQVEGEGDFTILSIKEGYDNQPKVVPTAVRLMRDSLTLLLMQKEDAEAAQTVWDEEEKFLNLNRSIGGQQAGIKVAELKEASDFYRLRLSEIKKGSLANRRKITKLNESIESLKARLYPFSADRISLNQTLTVVALANKPVKAILKISYFTSSAQWVPRYDIRSNGPGSPINLILKASVSNFSGENWDNVQLSFSTGQPQLNASPPTLYPWYLRPVTPPAPIAYSANLKKAHEPKMELLELGYDMAPASGSSADFMQRTEATTTIEYSLPIPQNIQTGKDPLVVEIEKKTLDAEYEYRAIAKLSTQVFLMAKAANMQLLNLLPAEASIYLNNAYTGTAQINPAMAQDTLTLPLGIDNSITVSRERIRDFKSKNLMGSRVSETIGWELKIWSLKSAPVSMRLTDQLPLTTDKNIKVEAVELSKGNLNTTSGMVDWNLTLEPGKSQILRLVYKVERPKDMNLYLE